MRIKEEFKTGLKAWKAEANLDDVVDTSDVAQVVQNWTGIPAMNLLEAETEKLLRMEEHLHKRIIGQDKAIEVVSDAIHRARQRAERSQAAHRHLPLYGADRRGQDRTGESAGRLPL